MNLLRGNQSRVRPAPMSMPTQSIPSSVEFVNHARQDEQFHKSQPIPIQQRRPSPQEREEDDLTSSAESASRYDMATWEMYARITNARRLRAVSRHSSAERPPQSACLYHDFHDVDQDQALRREAQPTPAQDYQDDGVFDFDAM